MKINLKDLAKYEQAIAQKYGEVSVANPRSFWDEEKEKKHLKELKEISIRNIKRALASEKVEKDGYLVSKKLINRESERTCPACFEYSFDIKDDVYMNKYDCCSRCYLQFVEDREERWSNLSERVDLLASYHKLGEK
jgi:hypothetical protein|tara:strand:+ start:62 stop:472 length:411 start_codon:yes stop_codon:yes gene_type:complete